MRRLLTCLLLVALASVNSACTSFAAPRKDQFYRLPDSIENTSLSAGAGVIVYVPPLLASGLHGERALIYAHDDGTSLEQYTYHYWVDSPRLLLQQALAAQLRVGGARRIVTAPSADAKYTVRGYLRKFERHGLAPGTAEVSLEFELLEASSDAPEFVRAYQRSVPLRDAEMATCAAALGQAAQDILASLVTDLQAHWAP